MIYAWLIYPHLVPKFAFIDTYFGSEITYLPRNWNLAEVQQVKGLIYVSLYFIRRKLIGSLVTPRKMIRPKLLESKSIWSFCFWYEYMHALPYLMDNFNYNTSIAQQHICVKLCNWCALRPIVSQKIMKVLSHHKQEKAFLLQSEKMSDIFSFPW